MVFRARCLMVRLAHVGNRGPDAIEHAVVLTSVKDAARR
jgi:hypothetical protein